MTVSKILNNADFIQKWSLVSKISQNSKRSDKSGKKTNKPCT